MTPERILVVDDEAAVRGIVSALLERSGYATTVAESAAEALNLLREQPAFDLVLSDIMMPGTDGLSLLDQICTDFPETPVVMCTAVQDVHVTTNAFRRGAIDYLLKRLVFGLESLHRQEFYVYGHQIFFEFGILGSE